MNIENIKKIIYTIFSVRICGGHGVISTYNYFTMLNRDQNVRDPAGERSRTRTERLNLLHRRRHAIRNSYTSYFWFLGRRDRTKIPSGPSLSSDDPILLSFAPRANPYTASAFWQSADLRRVLPTGRVPILYLFWPLNRFFATYVPPTTTSRF